MGYLSWLRKWWFYNNWKIRNDLLLTFSLKNFHLIVFYTHFQLPGGQYSWYIPTIIVCWLRVKWICICMWCVFLSQDSYSIFLAYFLSCWLKWKIYSLSLNFRTYPRTSEKSLKDIFRTPWIWWKLDGFLIHRLLSFFSYSFEIRKKLCPEASDSPKSWEPGSGF